METKGLLFIPDISGFTRFVTETEIEHSRLIIQELLEILICSNEIGLEISEIEGDAILFYKFGDSPDLPSLYKQVEKMFCAFHKNLVAYEHRRFCQCKACISAVQLTLKVITHYGEFASYKVQQFSKLIGKDVIVAHQLLKNDIPQHEYWLVTKSLLQDHAPAALAEWMQWNKSAKHTEAGDIFFEFTQLTPLKKTIEPEPYIKLQLTNKVRMLSLTKEYDTDMITLFHATGDFRYRSQWQQGVREVEELSHYLPRVGMRCRCILDNGEVVIYSSSYIYHPDKIEFSETDENKKTATYYTLEKLGEKKTKLTIDYYLQKHPASQLIFTLTKKNKQQQMLQQSMNNLTEVVKGIHLPAQQLD
jgi:hypothetical protein